MKNKKFLGILLSLGMVSGFSIIASARDISSVKDEGKLVAAEYIIKNKDMKPRENRNDPDNYDNLTDEKDAVVFYIIMKKILNDKGLLTTEIKERVLNKIISGDGKRLKLTTELDLFFDDLKDANKFKEAILNLDVNKMEITKDDFDVAKQDLKKHYEDYINKDKQEVKRYENALEKGDKAVLEEELAVANESLENLGKMKDNAKSKEESDNRDSDIKFQKKHIKELNELIKQLDSKKEKSKDFENKIASIKDESRIYVKNIKDFVNFSEDSVKKIINLKYDDVKGLEKDFKFNKNLKDLRTGEIF